MEDTSGNPIQRKAKKRRKRKKNRKPWPLSKAQMQEIGRRGGNKTFLLYGNQFYKDMAERRKTFSGGRRKKPGPKPRKLSKRGIEKRKRIHRIQSKRYMRKHVYAKKFPHTPFYDSEE